jgi:hypothetical protein
MCGAIPPLPQYAFMAWFSVEAQGQLCLYLQDWPFCVKWVSHNSTVRPLVVDGGDDLQIWRLAADILNKKSRSAYKEWTSTTAGGVGRGVNSSSP